MLRPMSLFGMDGIMIIVQIKNFKALGTKPQNDQNFYLSLSLSQSFLSKLLNWFRHLNTMKKGKKPESEVIDDDLYSVSTKKIYKPTYSYL
jgi:hypothetical protein